MLRLTGTLYYYLFNDSVDMRKGIYSLSDVVRHEMKQKNLYNCWNKTFYIRNYLKKYLAKLKDHIIAVI